MSKCVLSLLLFDQREKTKYGVLTPLLSRLDNNPIIKLIINGLDMIRTYRYRLSYTFTQLGKVSLNVRITKSYILS